MNAIDTMVAGSVKRLLAQHAESAPEHRMPHGLWRATVDAGLTRVLADVGSDVRESLRAAVTILRECAYDAAPIPLAEAMLANWLAARAGWQEADGLSTVVLECAAPVLALDDESSGTSQPTLRRVPWGRDADAIYALVRDGAHARIARFEPFGPPQRLGSNLADEPRDTVAVAAPPRLGDIAVNPQEVLALAALLRAAQLTGAMERTLDLAVDHARTRVQFGRAIGGFQAVQQMLAQHAGHVAAAAAAVDLAVDSWGTGNAIVHAGMAKSRAGEAAGMAAEFAHQVIAAMGYAMEHPLQRVTRRLWTWRDDYGNEAFWNDYVGAHFLAGSAANVWARLTDELATGAVRS